MRLFKVICVPLFEADVSESSMTSNITSLSLKLLLKGRLHIVVYEWIALKFAKLLGVCKAPRGTCMFNTPPARINLNPTSWCHQLIQVGIREAERGRAA